MYQSGYKQFEICFFSSFTLPVAWISHDFNYHEKWLATAQIIRRILYKHIHTQSTQTEFKAHSQ